MSPAGGLIEVAAPEPAVDSIRVEAFFPGPVLAQAVVREDDPRSQRVLPERRSDASGFCPTVPRWRCPC